MLRAYELPHECETAEVSAALAALSPRQRRVLRQYVQQVEFGEIGVTEWLRGETCPVQERSWYGKYYRGDPGFMAALETYTKALQQWQVRGEQRTVEQSQRELRLATRSAARRLIEQAESDIGQFFKVTERWTLEPQPTQEIVDEETREDDLGISHRYFRVRQVVLDLDKLHEPRFSRMVKKFADTPSRGLSIELYDALRAAESVLDRAGTETASKTLAPLSDAFEQALQRAYSEPDDGDPSTAHG